MSRLDSHLFQREIVSLLKKNAKDTLSIRVSKKCISELSSQVEEIKSREPDLSGLTVSKYAAILLERMTNTFSDEEI